MRVRHFSRSLHCGGGLQQHLDALRRRGHDVFGLLDGPSDGRGRVSIHQGGRTLAARWRRELKALPPADISVYHNGWGVDLMTGADSAPVRVCWLHSDFPNIPVMVRHYAPYADGFISVHPCMVERLRSELPWLPGKRNVHGSCYLPLDIDSLAQRAGPRERLVIGYLGRLEKQQKRIERLIPFCEYLRDLGADVEIEIAGTGRADRWIRRKLAGYPFVRFLGALSAEEIPPVLERWKYILFPSGFEGLPLALLEALAAGVVPVYPDFYDAADPVAKIAPALTYPQGELLTAADAVLAFEERYKQEYPQIRERAQRFLEAYRVEAVENQHSDLWQALSRLRPRSKRKPSMMLTWPPLWYYNRIYRYLTLGAIY